MNMHIFMNTFGNRSIVIVVFVAVSMKADLNCSSVDHLLLEKFTDRMIA